MNNTLITQHSLCGDLGQIGLYEELGQRFGSNKHSTAHERSTETFYIRDILESIASCCSSPWCSVVIWVLKKKNARTIGINYRRFLPEVCGENYAPVVSKWRLTRILAFITGIKPMTKLPQDEIQVYHFQFRWYINRRDMHFICACIPKYHIKVHTIRAYLRASAMIKTGTQKGGARAASSQIRDVDRVGNLGLALCTARIISKLDLN